jgi:phosphatidylserine/phosphatidylglycerophosphate/cardiolipin synthase-like enzyme
MPGSLQGHWSKKGVAAMIKSRMSKKVPAVVFALSLMLGFLPGMSNAHAQQSLKAEEWVAAELEACKAQENHRASDLDRLKTTLHTSALSTEELRFPEKEALDYEKVLKKERKVRLHDLEFLLFRRKGKTLEHVFLEQGGVTSTMSRQERASLQRAIHVFAEGVTPCLLNALGTTLVLADFGLPLRKELASPGMQPWQALESVEDEYTHAEENGRSLDESYLALRPANWATNEHLIEAMLEGMIEASPNSESLSAADRKLLSSRLEDVLRLSAEPLRIGVFVELLVGDFEREVGIRSHERLADHLQKELQKQLFADVGMQRALQEAPPQENLRRVYSIVDEWLRREGWLALQNRLYADPFSAYWFFVQTGFVVRRPAPFEGAWLRVDEQTPDLRELSGLSLRESQAAIERSKIPASYPKKYFEVERAMASVAPSPAEFLERAEEMEIAAADRDALAQIVSASEPGNGEISSLDLISTFIDDGTRLQIKKDRHAWVAGLKVFAQAKREVLQREVKALPEAPERDRLAAYLHTAGEWMLELDLRQATDKAFQLPTGGGPIGWWLRHTVIANGLPKTLWVPDGVAGPAFARMVDKVVPNDCRSYHCNEISGSRSLEFLESGETYHKALVNLIDGAEDFINIEQYDWKLDRGGREIAYRMMAKKLGLNRQQYDSLTEEFRDGLPRNATASQKILFYDIPTKRAKNLLFYKLFASSEQERIRGLRSRIEHAIGDRIRCPNLAGCGDLSKLYAKTGRRYDHRREGEAGYLEAWQTYRELQGMFEEDMPSLKQTRPQRSLAAYVKSQGNVQRFVNRYGLKRGDRPDRPFDVNIITEGKRDVWNWVLKTGKLQNPMMEFNLRYLPWKGPIEYPWHVGKLPLSGRWVAGVVPVPYVPWPWLQYTPGFGWAGIELSMVGQHFLATDIRNAWGMETHAKHIASESAVLESGMGFGSKYFNMYQDFRTWHDTGVLARGHVVEDGNEVFVNWFNRARRNNRGLPEARNVVTPRLDAEEYSYRGPREMNAHTWVLSTDPDAHDYNYRGVFLAALAAAHDNIYIENVFYSDPVITQMLVLKAREFRAHVNCEGLTALACTAKKRNAVNIHLVLPWATDQPIVDMVGRADYYEMISEGVKLYLWQPPQDYAAKRMMHTKAWLVDYREGEPALAYVGSHNADRRSLWSDNELGIVSTSPEFARAVHDQLFLRDMQQEASHVTPTGFELERKVRPKHFVGRLIRKVMAEVFWFF